MRTNKVYLFLLLIIGTGLVSAFLHIPGLLYSDIVPFYDVAKAPGFPDLSKAQKIDYPVITWVFIHLMGIVGQSRAGYYLLTALFLMVFATIATYLLFHSMKTRDKRRLLICWILAPVMFMSLIANWDIIVVLFVVLALYFIRRNKDYLASFSLALGFCAKFYPVLFLLPLLFRKRRASEWAGITAVFGATTLLINIYFMIANYEAWRFFFSFNSDRVPNRDSIWGVVDYWVSPLSNSQINALSMLLLVATLAILLWKFRHEPTIKLCFILTLGFLLTNKVYSPQYDLWLLPFFVLLPLIRMRQFYLLEVSNFFVSSFILSWFFIYPAHQAWFMYACHIFVITRQIALVWILIDLLKARRRSPSPATTPVQVQVDPIQVAGNAL